jgi:hypothetical protein
VTSVAARRERLLDGELLLVAGVLTITARGRRRTRRRVWDARRVFVGLRHFRSFVFHPYRDSPATTDVVEFA